MKVTVDPLILPLSDVEVGDIKLRSYQAQVMRCDDPRVLVSAPTGSGKTLAYLSRALKGAGGGEFHTVVIVYPTNALIWDQAEALTKLLKSNLGLKVNLLGEDQLESGLPATSSDDYDVLLIVANGQSLGALAQNLKSSEGAALTRALRGEYDIRIILTNPDILYYMFLYRFTWNEELLSALIKEKPPNLLVLDEVHLYYGYSLATLTYMLNYMKKGFHQIVFGSATPIEVDRILKEKCTNIIATESEEGQIAKHEYTLAVKGVPGIIGDEELDEVVSEVHRLYEAHRGDKQPVKVLVILNSVVTCVTLERRLRGEYPDGSVGAIHGLVPPEARPKTRSQMKPIMVGTSAIEVGVDFDTASLIFEAHDSSTFLQRLGRGARHSPCEIVAYVPQIYYPDFKKELSERSQTSNQMLADTITRVLPKPESYMDFPYSKYAAPILLSIYLNWVYERPVGGKQPNWGQAIKQLSELLDKDFFNIPQELEGVAENAKKILEKPPGCLLKMSREASMRGTLVSIPAVFFNYPSPQFDYVSLSELPKLKFTAISAEQLRQSGVKIPLKMRMEKTFLKVEEFHQKPPKTYVYTNTGNFRREPTSLYGNVKTNPRDDELETQIYNLINDQPAIILKTQYDWRLQGLRTSGNEYVVTGGDAYLAWYINENL